MTIENILKLSEATTLPTKVVINIGYTTSMLEESVASILKVHDISLPQYNVLRILKGQKGKPASLASIHERMVDTNSNTSRLVDKLIVKNFVKRRICPTNRRKVEIEITTTGLELLKTVDPLTEEANKNNLSNLSKEECILLNDLLNKIRTNE
ncbi:MarR family winged helix-turn-helix transcriptional regulator [Flavimarina sp. Hel_I_48]|uniref:MarR family winged helix-turn-helix transcriptional regulator n=1 Tax=Flavimarina sp. Hel_I_48 TaxID=1392488 RepID=UPI0004DF209B|nr:MarR family transcriptional regulator [Flavimarina sp. Hel_I_48]